jgi:signal transduction histidine kinase
MMIIVGGAILPLALIGGWLTASGARSGRELLRRELESSLAHVAQRMSDRWQHRSAELALLANNEPARRLLGAAGADPEATQYFQEMARALGTSMRELSYRDAEGRTRWSSREAASLPSGSLPETRRAVSGFNDYDAILVRRPVRDEDGSALGTVEARVLLSALLPTDSLQLIVAGSALRIRNREDGVLIGGPAAAPPGATSVLTRASLDDPPLDLELAASDARYVEPFARAARLGLGFLLGVAALALGLTAFLTRRLTGSLEQMVHAAGAVAAGDLERTVTGSGGDEIGRLAAAFNTMTQSLRRTLRELARGEALAAVGQFAASISHEVRNALTAVRLDLQRLSERMAPSDDRMLVRRMLKNVQRLDTIVTGSLRIARTDPDTMHAVVLEGVVRSAMSAAEPAFVESGTRAALEPCEEDRLRVRGDAGALEQMFLNLLMNAAQAMTAGGLVRVSIDQADAHVIVRIADAGQGIPPEILAKLGEPFFSSRSEGTGLGFSIARQIAVAHGGEASVVSTGLSGTTVEVVLPRAPAD